MAEAIRRALPAGGLAAGVASAMPSVVAPPLDRRTARAFAVPSVPAHVGTMLGLSVAGYGVALALVTGLQASSEAAINADRAPVATTIDGIAASNDRLGSGLRDATDRYGLAAADYQAVAGDLAQVEGRLAALARSVKAVDGAAKALPVTVALPPIVRAAPIAATTSYPTTTHATSGGSAPNP